MAEKQIKVTKDGQEGTIMESSWRVYERNGWTRADDGSSEPTEPEPEPKAPAKKTTTRKAAD